ncbi:hypothetical protein RB595_002324 [Gaeumannomyces hyphopodioides]
MALGGFCQDCFKGTLRGDAQPTGTVETIHGLPTYVARPDPSSQGEPLGLVVIVPDVFGWELLNTRALADSYARRGPFVVYLPDFMDGAAPPAYSLALLDKIETPSPSWWAALTQKPWLALQLVAIFVPRLLRIRGSVTTPRVHAFFQALRRSTATSSSSPTTAAATAAPPSGKVGVVGFCWGGRHAIDLCGVEAEAETETEGGRRPLVDCGFTAHPSMVKIPDALERVRVPLSVANGDNDAFMGRDKMATLKRVLEGVRDGEGGSGSGSRVHEVVVYEGAIHGFAVRGNPADPRQAEMGLKAEDQAVSWFRRQFSSA